jgi:hypothetical protein
MSQFGFFTRFVGFMFLVGLLTLGGYLVYQAGMAQGIAQTPVVVADASQVAPPVASPNGFFAGIGLPSIFNLFGAVCISMFFIFLFFGFVKFVTCFTGFGRQRWQTPNSDLNKAI